MKDTPLKAQPSDTESAQLLTLLHRITMRDEAALAALYEATVARVYGLALRITQRRELAEEVVSDVYLQVWRDCLQFDARRGSMLAWLMIQCRTRAIDALRRTKGAVNEDPLDTDPVADDVGCPQDLVIASEQQAAVRQALQSLGDRQRQLIALAFYRGMSHSELAEFTGLPLGTVKTLIRRGLATLREQLTDAGIALEDAYEHSG